MVVIVTNCFLTVFKVFKLFIKSYLRKLSVELGSALLLGCDLDQRFRYKKTSTEDTREVVWFIADRWRNRPKKR